MKDKYPISMKERLLWLEESSDFVEKILSSRH
jgi:hypothetical protein